MSKQDDNLIMNGAAEFNMEVFVINEEKGQKGKVTIGLGVFEFPTPEKVKERIAKFEAEELESIGDGFRVMSKREAWDFVMQERTGQSDMRFALPKGPEWDELS